MSVYTDTLKTLQIDPVFNLSRTRSEFRIPADALYLANLRLLNIGVSVTQADNTVRYNFLTGSASSIKNIFLYDGTTVLDQVLDFQNIQAFKMYNKSNEDNCDVKKIALNHGLGFVLARSAPNVPASVFEFFPNASNAPSNSDATTVKGFLSLKDVFPLLQKLDYLHAGLFKNLRLVIEYGTNISVNTGATVKDTVQPLLCVDQVLNESVAQKWLSEFKSVAWNALEVEKVMLETGETGKKQEKSFRLNGFEQKTLGRLLIKKTGLGTSVSAFYGTNGSEAMVDEKIQVRINGSNILPEGGCDKPNYRLGMLVDNFSSCNAIPCSNDTGCLKLATIVDSAAARVGHLDYFGLTISKKITDMQIEYSRMCRTGGAAQYAQPLLLHVIGEVAKMLVKTANGYSIVYL
jgi:hypothetical protein